MIQPQPIRSMGEMKKVHNKIIGKGNCKSTNRNRLERDIKMDLKKRRSEMMNLIYILQDKN